MPAVHCGKKIACVDAFKLRRIYKAEYLKFIVYALASNDEARDHLETLYYTNSLTDAALSVPSMCPHIDPMIAFVFNIT